MKDNKLIAEFMGLVYAPPSKRWDDWFTEDGTRVTFGSRIPLLYHSSWDWLHKVLDKVEDECILRERMADNLQSSGHLWFTSGYLYQCGTITEVYEAVVEFIKFYNQNK